MSLSRSANGTIRLDNIVVTPVDDQMGSMLWYRRVPRFAPAHALIDSAAPSDDIPRTRVQRLPDRGARKRTSGKYTPAAAAQGDVGQHLIGNGAGETPACALTPGEMAHSFALPHRGHWLVSTFMGPCCPDSVDGE